MTKAKAATAKAAEASAAAKAAEADKKAAYEAAMGLGQADAKGAVKNLQGQVPHAEASNPRWSLDLRLRSPGGRPPSRAALGRWQGHLGARDGGEDGRDAQEASRQGDQGVKLRWPSIALHAFSRLL